MLALLLILWIVFNGKVTVEILLFGFVLSGLLFGFLCKFMDYSFKKEIGVYRNLFRGVKYVFSLVVEIIKANFQVMKYVLSSKYEIVPKVVTFKTDLKSDAAKVALANSITLTPGTMTVDIVGDKFIVHCLDEDLAEGMEEGGFVQKLRKMEGNK